MIECRLLKWQYFSADSNVELIESSNAKYLIILGKLLFNRLGKSKEKGAVALRGGQVLSR